MENLDEDRVNERVREWRQWFKRRCLAQGIVVTVVMIFFLGARFSWDDPVSFTSGLKLHDYTLESIVVTVVVALVVAAAVSPQRGNGHRTQANLISLGVISQFISFLYPLYPAVVITLAPADAFTQGDTYQRIVVSVVVAVILVALAAVIQEFGFYQWEKKKKMQEERDLFIRALENHSKFTDNDPLNKTATWWLVLSRILIVILLLGFIAGSWFVGTSPHLHTGKILLVIVAVAILEILRTVAQFLVARSTGMVWIPWRDESTKNIDAWWGKPQRKRVGDDHMSYYYFVSIIWLLHGVVLLFLAYFLVREVEPSGEFLAWLAVYFGGLVVFSILLNVALGAFSFNVFDHIKREEHPGHGYHYFRCCHSGELPAGESDSHEENPTGGTGESFLPRVDVSVRICCPQMYREFAIERTLAVLNGERVEAVKVESQE